MILFHNNNDNIWKYDMKIISILFENNNDFIWINTWLVWSYCMNEWMIWNDYDVWMDELFEFDMIIIK